MISSIQSIKYHPQRTAFVLCSLFSEWCLNCVLVQYWSNVRHLKYLFSCNAEPRWVWFLQLFQEAFRTSNVFPNSTFLQLLKWFFHEFCIICKIKKIKELAILEHAAGVMKRTCLECVQQYLISWSADTCIQVKGQSVTYVILYIMYGQWTCSF